MKRIFAFAAPGLAVLALDQWLKTAAKGLHQPLIAGVIGLNWTENTGMALGLFQGGTLGILILTAAMAVVCFLLLRGMKLRGLAPIALSLIAGGAVGNLIDRVTLGYVRDMFETLFMKFYIFNIADVGVVLGAILCGISLLFRPQDWSKEP